MSKSKRKLKYAKKNAEYAQEYNCTVRTITRYKAQGFPLDDPDKMREILDAQKVRPPADGETLDCDLPEDKLPIAEAKRRKEIVAWQRAAHALAVEQGKFKPNETIIEDGYAIGAAVAAALDKLHVDLPSLCLGKDEVSMSTIIRRETDKIRLQLSDMVKKATA